MFKKLIFLFFWSISDVLLYFLLFEKWSELFNIDMDISYFFPVFIPSSFLLLSFPLYLPLYILLSLLLLPLLQAPPLVPSLSYFQSHSSSLSPSLSFYLSISSSLIPSLSFFLSLSSSLSLWWSCTVNLSTTLPFTTLSRWIPSLPQSLPTFHSISPLLSFLICLIFTEGWTGGS